MVFNNTDRAWKKYGELEPYFGVVTEDKYKKENLTGEVKEAFFNSGELYLNRIISNIKNYIEPDFSPVNALDFGCGVGRLIIPMSKISQKVTGVDISESMLREAQLNCQEKSVCNAVFIKSDKALSNLQGKFDLIHSYIVFQHIPTKFGEKYFTYLLDHLEDGGVCVVHFTYSIQYGMYKNIIRWIKEKIPLTHNISNILRLRKFNYPRMQMNSYNLNKIFYYIQRKGILNFFSEFTNHNDALGLIIYFQKPKKD